MSAGVLFSSSIDSDTSLAGRERYKKLTRPERDDRVNNRVNNNNNNNVLLTTTQPASSVQESNNDNNNDENKHNCNNRCNDPTDNSPTESSR